MVIDFTKIYASVMEVLSIPGIVSLKAVYDGEQYVLAEAFFDGQGDVGCGTNWVPVIIHKEMEDVYIQFSYTRSSSDEKVFSNLILSNDGVKNEFVTV